LIGEDIFEGAMPGNLRKSTDFVAFLKRALHYIDITYLKKKEVSIESTRTFLDGIKLGAHCEEAALKYIDRRLHILLQTLQLTDSEEISTLLLMSQFLTLASTQQEGFKIILEPYADKSSIVDPTLQFVCLDARIAIAPVF
jgi:DNA excision repair protein ERCC-2